MFDKLCIFHNPKDSGTSGRFCVCQCQSLRLVLSPEMVEDGKGYGCSSLRLFTIQILILGGPGSGMDFYPKTFLFNFGYQPNPNMNYSKIVFVVYFKDLRIRRKNLSMLSAERERILK